MEKLDDAHNEEEDPYGHLSEKQFTNGLIDAQEIGLKGANGDVYEVKRIVGMTKKRGTNQIQYMVEWDEKFPGQYEDNKYSLEPASDIPGEIIVDFHRVYKGVERGVSILLCPLMLFFVTH